MGRPRKNNSEIDETIDTRQNVILYKPEIVNEDVDIYTKYNKYVLMANSGYMRDLSNSDAIEILRHCEKVVGHSIPVNLSCAQCVIDLVQLFGRLKNR